MTRSLAAVALLAFSACAVGPKYQRPETEVPTAFRYTLGAGRGRLHRRPAAGGRCTGIPILQGLIEEALRSNQDLRVAAARVTEARAHGGRRRRRLLSADRARRRRRLRPAVGQELRAGPGAVGRLRA